MRQDFIVEYNGVVIGNIKNNHYFPDKIGIEKCKTIFLFLKEEIDNIMEVNFFKSRIENCSRFGDDFSYSGDEYLLKKI